MNNNYEQNGQNIVPQSNTQPVMPQSNVDSVVSQQTNVESIEQPVINQSYGYNNMTPVQNNKKKSPIKEIVIIVITLVVIVAIGYFLYSKIFNGQDDTYLEILDQNKLIPIKENDLYGYINTNGKVVIKPQYTNAEDFNGGYAVVTAKNLSNNKSVAYIIDEKGKVKFQSEEDDYISSSLIEYIVEDRVWIIDDRLYDKNLKLLTSKAVTVEYDDGVYTFHDEDTNKYGIINSKGKKIYTYQVADHEYFSISASELSEDLENQYCVVRVSNYSNDTYKYGIINCDTGKEVVALSDKYIYASDNNIFEVGDKKSDSVNIETMLYIQGDKILYQTDAKDGDVELEYYSDGYIEIEDNTKSYSEEYSYYIIDTGTVTENRPSGNNRYLNDWEKETGITRFECGNDYGLMSDEKVLLTCEWNDIEFLSVDVYNYIKTKTKNQVVLLEKDNKVLVYDLKNKKSLFTFNSSYVYDYYDSTFIKATDSDSKEIIIYNLATHKYQRFDSNAKVYTYSNYITVKLDGKVDYYNTKLEKIYTVNDEE